MSIPADRDAAKPRRLPAADTHNAGQAPISHEAIVGMLAAWVDVKMGEVDDLVDEARDKVAAIPSWRLLVDLVGELVIRVHALEYEVARLKGGRT